MKKGGEWRKNGAKGEAPYNTNTIHIPEEKRFEKLRILSVADLLAKAIDYVHSNESVSQLFEIPPDN